MLRKKKRSPLREKPLRVPGQSLEYMIEDTIGDMALYFLIVALVSFFLIIELYSFLNHTKLAPDIVTIILLIVFPLSVHKLVSLRKKLLSLRLGQEGERTVGEELQALQKDGAAVLHDVIGDKFNVDHIIISKNGIFVLETKTIRKPIKGDATIQVVNNSILVNGKTISRDPIQQVKNLSKWTQGLLLESTGKNFPVRPVVLFPGWFIEPMESGAEVWILNPKALPAFVRNSPEIISDTDVHLVTYHLSRYIRVRGYN